MSGLEGLHFLRPFWLLGLVPVVLLVWMLYKQARTSKWRYFIDARLLPYLLESDASGKARWPWRLLLLGIGWLAVTLALAGPVWQKLPVPIDIRKDALIILLDLSFSMAAQDILPSRVERAKFKLLDLFDQRVEGQTALMVYAGDAHVVVPFTDDTNNLRNLLPALSPGIMPTPGSRVDLALARANKLFSDNQIAHGTVLLITDSISSGLQDAVQTEHELVVLGVGTTAGAPIPNPHGDRTGFLRDKRGRTVIARLNEDAMISLIAGVGGSYHRLTLNETDLNQVLLDKRRLSLAQAQERTERKYDVFVEQGHWLTLLCLPALFGLFRRGMLATWLLWLLMPMNQMLTTTAVAQQVGAQRAEQAQGLADIWRGLVQSDDRVGYELLQQGKPKQALEHFQEPGWRAAAHYKQGDYAEAQSIWSEGDGADSAYNRGNALARQGDFKAARDAYDEAIQAAPDMEDAHANRALMDKLLAQQQQAKAGGEGDNSQEQDGQQQAQQDGQQQQGDGQQEQEQGDGQQEQDGQQQAGATDAENEEAGQQQAQEAGQESSEQEKPGQMSQRGQEQQAADDAKRQANADAEALQATEQQQALQQWLRRIPDNPGGLLRRKFQHEARIKQRQRLEQPEETW